MEHQTSSMVLPVTPPVQPMLARLVRRLPEGDVFYEPKWDGFRCLVFRDRQHVDLRSRNDRPMARYFPELVSAIASLPGDAAVIDGEITVTSDGVADFAGLLARLHPAASRVAQLAQRTPATFVAFDVLAIGADGLCDEPFVQRRRVLEDVMARTTPPLSLTPVTRQAEVAARWLRAGDGAGIDGVMVKPADLTYQPGRRAMTKVKTERTADCVVAGARVLAEPPGVASLLLALYDDADVLRHVGVASSFTHVRRRELLDEIAPYVVPLDEHPWRDGFGGDVGRVAKLPGAATRWTPQMSLDWVPLRPELVCEVAYEHVDSGLFRHPARFRHWRPDRDAESCRTDQLRAPGGGMVQPA